MDEQQEQQPPQQAPSPYPRPDMGGGMMGPTQEERSQSMLCWILTIFAGFIPGLIFYLISDQSKPFLKRQAALALTLSIVAIVGYIASAILMMILIGIVTYIAVGIWSLVVCIMGAVACNKGDNYSPGIVTGLCQSMFKM